jgi:hypothetical protein
LTGPRVLIGYECSGVVRRAFRAWGFDAWSCDIQPGDDGSPHHLQGDVWAYTDQDWDLAILHPPCTYLTRSATRAVTDGPYHQKIKPATLVGAAHREAREEALEEIRALMALPYPKAIENPQGFIGTRIKPFSQMIQPFQFGDDASKGTCLWLDDRLPLLQPTLSVAPAVWTANRAGATRRRAGATSCRQTGPGTKGRARNCAARHLSASVTRWRTSGVLQSIPTTTRSTAFSVSRLLFETQHMRGTKHVSIRKLVSESACTPERCDH